jgi:hypothetical protein
LEDAGIGTIIIATIAFRKRLEAMKPPRVLLTRHPMGRPIGPPGNPERQSEVIQAALEVLQTAEAAGTVRVMPGFYTY